MKHSTIIIIVINKNNKLVQNYYVPRSTASTLCTFRSDQISSSVMSDSVTPWIAAGQASLSITNSLSSLRLMSIELMMPSNHLIHFHPLLLPSVFPSIWVFSSESTLQIRWPKDWSFSFSIRSSNEYWGLISFRIDWLDLLAVQGTLKTFLQHRGSKASILQCSAFFMVQLSHPYMTAGKTVADLIAHNLREDNQGSPPRADTQALRLIITHRIYL